jgi:tRNA G10  N-methylase Trm11
MKIKSHVRIEDNVSPKLIDENFIANTSLFRKRTDYSWDFRRANTKEYNHCFHTYPAMMIPQVARRILENFGKGAKLLFDPYCGTGTSLVEANLRGINSVGTDVNPLARLIATSKTTKINIPLLDSIIYDFNDYIFKLSFQEGIDYEIIIPPIKNIDYWFSKDVQQKLGTILNYIERIKDEKIKNFFKVAFSETVRDSSFLKSGEFKLVRSKNFENKNGINVFKLMSEKLSRNKMGLIEFQNACPENVETKVYDFNTVFNIPTDILPTNSVDIVLTSPPYGDSKTTVAYGQFSRFANEWLGYSEANQIDKKLMGGMKKKNHQIFSSSILNDLVNTLIITDEERTFDVISFYSDYESSIKNISAVVKKKGFACFVVGNRTVKGITIPNDEITAELLKGNGFSHVETIIRNIPNKRMPLKNSPSNVVGETASTMKNEYIVICQKTL